MRVSNGLTLFSAIVLISLVFSKTLSLQGNMVQEPIDSQLSKSVPNLKECARMCMEDSQCLMLIYNTNNKFCQMAFILSETPTRTLNQYELAYLRGPECDEDRQMLIRTRKMGKFYNNTIGHRYTAVISEGFPGMTKEDPEFCSVVEDVPECGLKSFGSADGGKSLTKNTTLRNYAHYGYCAPTKGSCNAQLDIYEYRLDFPVEGNNFYSNWPKKDQPTDYYIRTQFFCYFWSEDQCTPAFTSYPFSYSFQMKY